MKKSKEIEVQPFTLKHQYASSPYFSQYISYSAHKDNLSNNQERLLRQIQGQRFTCRLGFSPRALMYIFKFFARKRTECYSICRPFIVSLWHFVYSLYPNRQKLLRTHCFRINCMGTSNYLEIYRCVRYSVILIRDWFGGEKLDANPSWGWGLLIFAVCQRTNRNTRKRAVHQWVIFLTACFVFYDSFVGFFFI